VVGAAEQGDEMTGLEFSAMARAVFGQEWEEATAAFLGTAPAAVRGMAALDRVRDRARPTEFRKRSRWGYDPPSVPFVPVRSQCMTILDTLFPPQRMFDPKRERHFARLREIEAACKKIDRFSHTTGSISAMSQPEPLTQRTSVARPRWSGSVVFTDVLPPPWSTSAGSRPRSRDE
jgi:hypothetical protein